MRLYAKAKIKGRRSRRSADVRPFVLSSLNRFNRALVNLVIVNACCNVAKWLLLLPRATLPSRLASFSNYFATAKVLIRLIN